MLKPFDNTISVYKLFVASMWGGIMIERTRWRIRGVRQVQKETPVES
jgi:hypothetical protein